MNTLLSPQISSKFEVDRSAIASSSRDTALLHLPIAFTIGVQWVKSVLHRLQRSNPMTPLTEADNVIPDVHNLNPWRRTLDRSSDGPNPYKCASTVTTSCPCPNALHLGAFSGVPFRRRDGSGFGECANPSPLGNILRLPRR